MVSNHLIQSYSDRLRSRECIGASWLALFAFTNLPRCVPFTIGPDADLHSCTGNRVPCADMQVSQPAGSLRADARVREVAPGWRASGELFLAVRVSTRNETTLCTILTRNESYGVARCVTYLKPL